MLTKKSRIAGNTHQNNTRVSANSVNHGRTYIVIFLIRHDESIDDDRNDDLYTSSLDSLARFYFCWWRHKRLLGTSQWSGSCDAITWIMISNSLDIDFIHGQSCENRKLWNVIIAVLCIISCIGVHNKKNDLILRYRSDITMFYLCRSGNWSGYHAIMEHIPPRFCGTDLKYLDIPSPFR